MLFVLLACGSVPAFAQESRYRVEVLVLRHLEQNEEPHERVELPDYSMAIDFLTPPGEVDEAGDAAITEPEESEDATAETESLPDADTSAEDADGLEVQEDPNRLVHVEEMSSTMQEAWRRLRLSGPYRPEQYLSWEQGNQEPFPALRLHDLEAILVDDPWADFRVEPDVTTTVFTDSAPLDAVVDGDEMEGPALPDPIYYYRIDGVVTLRRTRFLHLDLDLQLREPVWTRDLMTEVISAPVDEQPAKPTSFRVYDLKQSRQVRTGRMEYFDGPVLAVLAWITEVEEESGESP